MKKSQSIDHHSLSLCSLSEALSLSRLLVLFSLSLCLCQCVPVISRDTSERIKRGGEGGREREREQ